MSLMTRSFLVEVVVLLLITVSSFAKTEENNDVGAEDELVAAFSRDTVDTYGKLPEFQEGVTVKVLSRLNSCVRRAARGNWLELDFVAKQMSDDGETYEEFDSTWSRNKLLLIAVHDKTKFPGLSEGLRDVCIGEKREITILPESPFMKVDPKSGLKQPKMDRAAIYEVSVESIQDREPINMFARMDTNSDKNLSREEVKGYFASVHFEEKVAADEAEILFLHQDVDKNDVITFGEFQGPKYDHDEF